MSLRVWLPLDGDLHNQGISDYTTNLISGNVFTTPGKIGNNSLHLTKLQPILPNSTASCMQGAKQMSYAYWIKVNTAWETNWLDGIRWISTDGSTTHTSRQEFYTNCTLIGTWFQGDSISGKSFTPGVWTHIAGTFNYNTGEVCFYINGTLSQRKTTLATTHYCRGDFWIGDNGVDIQQNDVRIYDHCLSAAEVKEIAQGLVLHYKLDSGLFGNPNVLTNSTGNLGSAAGWSGVISLGTDEPSPYLIASRTDTTSSSRTFVHHGNIKSLIPWATAGTHFTLSGYYKVPSSVTYNVQANMFLRWTHAAGASAYTDTGWYTPSSATVIKDKWIYFEQHYTVPTSYVDGAVNFYLSAFNTGLSTVYWKDIKLEEGNTATAWCPADSEMNIDRTIVEDSSGYNNNGIINGNMSINSNTAKYNNAIVFNGSDNAIQIPFNDIIKTDDYTISVWTYKETIGTKSYQTILGGPSGFELEARSGSSTSPLYRIHNWGGGTTAYEFNKWNLFTFVRTINDSKLYVNGELRLTGTAGTIPTGNYFIGAWSNTTKQNYEGLMSDFRIYCTPLLDTDIKQLYNVGMKVDNKQNIHTHEIKEDGDAAKIKKIAITQAPVLIEGGGLLNNITSYSVKPGADATNQTSNSCICDFSEVADLGVPIALHCSYTVSWNNMVTSTAGTLAVRMQGSNTRKSDGANVWAGANYIMPTAGGYTTNYITISAASGNQAFDYDSTIPASWFDTYTGSRLGIRIDYSDGNGTITVSDIKVTYRPTAQIGRNYIKANQFIEK